MTRSLSVWDAGAGAPELPWCRAARLALCDCRMCSAAGLQTMKLDWLPKWPSKISATQQQELRLLAIGSAFCVGFAMSVGAFVFATVSGFAFVAARVPV